MKQYNSSKEMSLKKKVKSFLSRNVQEYCENTSIHGLKYIVNKSLYPFERFFFAISFVCVVLGTAYFVAKIYEKSNYTPMIVSINPKNRYIIDEPFPAVTICNLNQASKKKVEKLSEYSFEYAIIQMMCKRKVNHTIADAISDWSNIKNLILETSQSCKKMLLECKYGGQVFNCTEIFNPIITDNGLCCTFNIVNPKFVYRSTISKSFLKNDFKYPKGYVPVYWSPDKGYQKDLPEKFIPMKGVGIGESLGLKIMLNVEADNYYCSSSDGVGFKILLHNPLEVPHMREVGLLLEPGHETKMTIRTERIESDEYVRKMKQSSRKCFFEDEKYLQIYNAYTEQNCVTECSAGQIYRNCNCVPFFKPMLFDNDSICSFYDTSCVERIRLQIMLIEQSGCALICQGSCNDMKYSSSLFSAPLVIADFKHPIQIKRNMSNDYWIKNVAIVNIFFKDSTYRSEKNMDFAGATDFLSNIGGIIGLFFGFSFVSLAELIFYAILRPLRMLIVSKWTRIIRSAKVQNKKQITYNYGTLEANSFNNRNVLLGVTAWKVAGARNHMFKNKNKNLNYPSWQPDGVGFKILLHNPLEVPHMREVGLLLEPGHETKMTIRTERIESDEYVRNMKQSFYNFYNAYTEQNCVTECSAGQIYRNCNCVPFFKPMLFDNDSICSFYDTSCVERIRLQIMLIEQSGCALICQGSCNDMKYSSSLFSAPLVIADFKHPIQIKRNMSNDYWIKNVAIVNIFFKDSTYRSEKNMDFAGATDFLSNIGGIIGLFFGFSFVSLAELIFYAILRPLRMLIVSKWTRIIRSAKVQNKKQITHNYGTLKANSFNNQNVLLGVTAWKVAGARNHMLKNKNKNLNYPSWQPEHTKLTNEYNIHTRDVTEVISIYRSLKGIENGSRSQNRLLRHISRAKAHAIQFVEMAVRERTFALAGYWKKLKKLKDAYKDYTNEFLRNSTIHGLVYLNKPELNIFERIFFMLTFMVLVVLNIHFLLNVTEKWTYSPTIASLNSKPDYITDDPFPTLTICNMNQALKSKVENISIYSQDYAILQTLCHRKANTTVINSITNLAIVTDFITRVAQPCERMLVDCHFGGIKYNCSHIFRAVLMSEGICCTFNSLDPKFNFADGTADICDEIRYPPDYKAVDWTLENGYQNPLPKYFTPMKAVGKGQSLGLKVILNVESDEYCCSSSNSVGFKIATHNPNERPDIFETGLLIEPGVESFVRIIPNKINADEKLRGLRPEDRNCIFINEYSLKTFLRYSYINCMYECRTAMAIYYCGCIAPYMAPISPNSSVCKYESWSCLKDIRLAPKIKEFGCGQRCWHSCISKTFRMDVFAATLENGAMESIRPLIGNASINYVKRNIAVAKFYIEHLTYTSVKQAPYIGPLNVLSSFGGLLSVFFGFSFISLAELIYYICIRPCRTITTSTGKTGNGNDGGQKLRIQLANRSKIHYVNPYRNPIYTVKIYPPFNREQMH